MSVMGDGPLARFARVKHPVARDEGLLVEHLADETVVYDSETKDAHCLSPLAAAVFAHCDGETSVEQLAALASERLGEPVDEPRVIDALVQLQERDLLAVPPGDGLSRRQMIGKSAAVAGGVVFGAPLITSIAAPTAAMAQTGIPPGCAGCTKNPDCQSNHCCQDVAGKQCSQGCCVGLNNSCHTCLVNGVPSCTVTPVDLGTTGCPTPAECSPNPVCCTETPPC